MDTATNRFRRLAALVHRALWEHENALRVPFLGDDGLRPLAVVEVPLWATYEDGVAAIRLLEAERRIVRLEEAELLPLAGHGLPLRRCWPEGVDHGWRVVR